MLAFFIIGIGKALSSYYDGLNADRCTLLHSAGNEVTGQVYYRKVNRFAAIAGATHLPVTLYNVPSRTVTNMSAETVIRLSHIDNIVAVKEASANYEQIARIIQGVRPGFLVYSGNDSDTLPILAMGGHGVSLWRRVTRRVRLR